MSIMTSQSKFQVTLMFWLTEVFCVLWNRSRYHYLLEAIATCDNKDSNLVMYFTINMAFTNYCDMLPNSTNPLQLIKDRTTYEQPLPIYLNIPNFDSSLPHAPTNLKSFMNDYARNKEILI